MSECAEVAAALNADIPASFTSMNDLRGAVRLFMRNESMQIIDNVAWSIYAARTNHSVGRRMSCMNSETTTIAECDETAESILKATLASCTTLDEIRREVRRCMPDAAEQIIDNVAWSIYGERHKTVAPNDPTSFSPVPWTIEPARLAAFDNESELLIEIMGAGGASTVCYATTRHNAQLIVAAPRLLASLQELSQWMRDNTGPADGTVAMLREACAAIKDAMTKTTIYPQTEGKRKPRL